jgi:hypothetical protein
MVGISRAFLALHSIIASPSKLSMMYVGGQPNALTSRMRACVATKILLPQPRRAAGIQMGMRTAAIRVLILRLATGMRATQTVEVPCHVVLATLKSRQTNMEAKTSMEEIMIASSSFGPTILTVPGSGRIWHSAATPTPWAKR